jgi:hypothetical protein
MSENNAEQIALDSVSSLAADAFSRLTQLQEELRRRLQAVAVREGALDALAKNLETRGGELKAFAAQLETRSKDLDQKAADAEARVGRREDVVSAFQEVLAHMYTALHEMTPDSIMAALDAGTAYEERTVSGGTQGAVAAAASGAASGGEPPARPAIGLTPQEQKTFFALRETGKSDAEILAGIYAARQQAAPSGAAA